MGHMLTLARLGAASLVVLGACGGGADDAASSSSSNGGATATGSTSTSASTSSTSSSGAGGHAPASCPKLPAGASYVDVTVPDGVEPDSTACSPLARVASMAATPAVAAKLPGKFVVTYTYLYRAPDGAVVMIDAGFDHWITGGTPQAPVVEENTALRDTLSAVVGALSPGKSLKDVAAVYFVHAHVDHTMQARWVHEAKGAPLDLWIGEADVPIVQSTDAALGCTGQFPAKAAKYLPMYLAPDYVVHAVPTPHVATKPSEWVDGGHGVTLIAAPSHTRGTMLVYLEALHATIGSNHLKHPVGPAECSKDVSTCKAECPVYPDAEKAFPKGAKILHVHPEGTLG